MALSHWTKSVKTVPRPFTDFIQLNVSTASGHSLLPFLQTYTITIKEVATVYTYNI